MDEAGYQKLKAAVRTLSVVTTMLDNQETTLQSLRNLLCSGQTEKTAAVLERAGIRTENTPTPPKPKASGHGRDAAKAYRGATTVQVPHASLKPGDHCPECKGIVRAATVPTFGMLNCQTLRTSRSSASNA